MPPAETEVPSSESISTSQQIPPTNQSNTSPTNVEDPKDRQIRIMEDSLREMNRTINTLNEQVSRNNNPPAPPEAEITAEEYYKDPIAAQRRLINEALERTVKPLANEFYKMQAFSRLDQIIGQFKNDARFSPQWDNGVEQYVRNEAARLNPDHLNEQNVGAIVLVAIGMKASGLLAGSTPTSAPAPKNNNPTPTPSSTVPNRSDIVPPYLAPSSTPSADSNSNSKKRRELNEHELRLAREKKMTPEQYLDWLDVPASAVVASEIGRPPKTGGQ